MAQNWDYAELSKAAKVAGGPEKYVEMELSINVQSKNTQNLKQPYRPYLLSASSTAEVRAG